MRLGPDNLVGQFILSRSASAIPETWSRQAIGNWHLGYHSMLKVYNIRSREAVVIGWLLGYPIDSEARLVTEDVHFAVVPDAQDAADQFETFLYTYGGRFAAVLLDSETARLYLDPYGSLAAVYSASEQIVAATSALIPYTDGKDEDKELIQVVHGPSKDTYFPFGLTPRRSVERLLPNHYLDLVSWQAVRHWPKGDIAVSTDVSAAVSELIQLVKNNISATAKNHNIYMSLTAGRDTRMLLACARDYLNKIKFVLFEVQKSWGRLDAQVAPKIAKKSGLDYEYVRRETPTERELQEWSHRTGNCITGAQWIRTYERLDPHRAIFLGAGGELGRGFHWREGDTEESLITADDLLDKRELPLLDEIRTRAEQWLAGLPTKNSLTKWGLLYNEQFNGCWIGPLFYGFTTGAFYLCPFCHRRIMELMLSLPTDYRRENNLPIDIINSEWPELLRLPFNWPVGYRRYIYGLQWRWSRLKQKLNLSVD